MTPQQVIGHLEHSGKVYLSGIDGSGKTELARQVLAILKRRSAYSRIACVQYDKSLEAGFAAAFTGLSGADCIKNVKALLENPDEGRALLMIDNVNSREDAGLDLLACFNCDILITGHLTSFDGMETITVPPMTEQEGIALLSLSVGRGLEKEEMEEAKALVHCVHGHPLTLTLLGSLCCTRFWKIEELRRHVDEFGMMNLIDSSDLNSAANGLFRVLPPGRLRPLIRLIAFLGYRSWKPVELLEYTCDITDSEKELSAQLNSLNTEGWLVWNEDGYLMHPVIA